MGLIRVGEQELTGEDEAEVDAYFAPDFTFHGPDGAETDYEGLKGYFASLRAAFDDLTISRGIMVVEGDYVACQTTISGTFVRSSHTPLSAPFHRMTAGSFRAHERLPIRRPRATRRGMGADGQPKPAASVGRGRPLKKSSTKRQSPDEGLPHVAVAPAQAA
jgi:hypothetical protein